ncbi:hypothetical protein [Nocardioides houyundeii]|uniref:hypothetical protein n=1 Tax=Nocardioides houyundeii TaxID=2045452 RepID=UPI0013157330|nr:hypothetical protein [Nocardioides houyundeii]
MSRYVDYSPEQTPVGRCVVLPGRRYTADGPLLFFATHTALARGWSVRQVWWEAPPAGTTRAVQDEIAWVGDQLDDAVDGYDGRVLVVAKSLGPLGSLATRSRWWPATTSSSATSIFGSEATSARRENP